MHTDQSDADKMKGCPRYYQTEAPPSLAPQQMHAGGKLRQMACELHAQRAAFIVATHPRD